MMLLSEFLLCDSWGQTYISNTQALSQSSFFQPQDLSSMSLDMFAVVFLKVPISAMAAQISPRLL